MASQLNHSSPPMMEPWADAFAGYGDPCLGPDGTAPGSLPLMFPDLWPLEAGDAHAAPLLPLYPVPDDLSPPLDDLSPPLGDEDMVDIAAPPPPAYLDPYAWLGGGGGALAGSPFQPFLWFDDDAAVGGFDVVPPSASPGVASFHADSPAWQAAPRRGGYRAPQKITTTTTSPPSPPSRRRAPRQHQHQPQPAPPASRSLAPAAPAVKRSHSGTPLARAAAARRASLASAPAPASDWPPAVVEPGDALPGALQGLVDMEQGLRSATHKQQRLLSATYEQWDRRRPSAASA